MNRSEVAVYIFSATGGSGTVKPQDMVWRVHDWIRDEVIYDLMSLSWTIKHVTIRVTKLIQ